MKEYKMKLLPEYFNYIKEGTKRIELRLSDEKRKDIAIGDMIVFEEQVEEPRYLKTKVVEIFHRTNFEELINEFDIELLADKSMPKEDLKNVLEKIYPQEVQTQYGVVGIKIEIIEDTFIDNIKNYFSKESKTQYDRIIKEIYDMSKFLNDIYPGYEKWFFEKQLNGCHTELRNIFFVKNEEGKVVGFTCLKKYENEKKICTILVDEEYRRKGIGTLLFEEAMKYLETPKPLITFPEDRAKMFESFIKKYEWELTDVLTDAYNQGIKEFCYNGKLVKE